MFKRVVGLVLGLVMLAGVVFAADTPRLFRKLADPTASSDFANGYTVGDFWFNELDGKLWICFENTVTAATWRQLTVVSPTITSPTVAGGTFSSPTFTGTATMSGVTLDNIGMLQIEPQTATYVAGQGYVLSGVSVATIYSIPIDSAAAKDATDKCPTCLNRTGVTVEVITPTTANHGQIIGVRNTSGTTPFVIRAGGLPVKTTSGVTHVGGEDVGDITWIQLSYGTGVSVYVLNEFKND